MKVENFVLSEQKEEQFKLPISIAVHLHLFYPDLIPEFLEYLRHIPVPFSLFVSVPDCVVTEDDEVEKSFRTLPNVQEITIKHTPNRGRDIAPMVCSFANELQKYDVMLHLHTKKSLHNKSFNGWLEHILEHLLPAQDRLSVMLTLLTKEAGMIIPPDYIYHGWGAPENLVLAQGLIDRSDMKINLKEEYPEIDFPQGSMFWARTEHLKRLFALGLTYEDFPQEPIGVDGTIAHALERLFILWGEGSGKKVYRLFFSEEEIMTNQRDIMRKLNNGRLYYVKKNDKHLRIVRILGVVCAVQLILLILSIIL